MPAGPHPTVSVIIPCRNEARYIGNCLESVLASEYPREHLQILVVDGESDDGTRSIADDVARRHRHLSVTSNPRRSAPAAMNIGIASTSGEIVVRMDAHVVYPPDYIPRLVDWLDRSRADNVGGVCITKPGNDTVVARAIALVLSHPFGVGNSYFRIGVAEPRWVDTVPFGCYRRSVFDRIGGYDEQLVRNQDDELNFRLVAQGGRILLVPDVTSQYFARETIGQVARMYYQYGFFKPIVGHKIGRIMTVRQLVPAGFVLGLVLGALFSLWHIALGVATLALLGAYGLVNLISSAQLARRHGLLTGLMAALVFPIVHVSYGVGFWRGLLTIPFRRGKLAPETMPSSR